MIPATRALFHFSSIQTTMPSASKIALEARAVNPLRSVVIAEPPSVLGQKKRPLLVNVELHKKLPLDPQQRRFQRCNARHKIIPRRQFMRLCHFPSIPLLAVTSPHR